MRQSRFIALVTAAAIAAAGLVNARAAVFAIDISPGPGLALNLGANPYTRDHTLGLSALNAVGQPASLATGGEIGAGLSYDDVSNMLTVNVGYGSDFGFADLAGDYSTSHIHGPIHVQFSSPNTGAPVVIGAAFNGLHAAGSSARTGSYAGSFALSAAQETNLFDNDLYINIHSGFAGGGEIRGQLIVVPEPSSALLLVLAPLFSVLRRVRRTRAL